MSSSVKFNYDDVEDYCVKIESCITNIDSIIENYSSNMKMIKSGTIWEGEAATAFIEKIDNTEAVLLAMKKSLINSVDYIRECSTKFSDLEKSIMEALDKIL